MRQGLVIALLLCSCTADLSDEKAPDAVFRGPTLDQAFVGDLDGSSAAMDGRVPEPDVDPVDLGRGEPDTSDSSVPLGNPYLPRRPNPTCRLPEPPPIGRYVMERAYPRLQFERPIWLGVAPGDPSTIFVAEQAGRIYAFDDSSDVRTAEVFLELRASRAGNEEGLLGVVFHPDYEMNGRFFVYYSAQTQQCAGAGNRCSIISEFRRGEPRRAEAGSERRLLVIPQPYSNHNGGDLRFGPDGLLYISVGDGGSANDPRGHGQNTDTLLGTILRIDVDDRSAGEYGIPPTNPFVAGGGRPEIYAWGLRNVWRMSFDPSTGALWAADVGQNWREEINKITEPGNFGWKIMEGDGCFRGNACDQTGLVQPVHTYNREAGESVTGGFVYRGQRLPELWGRYIFADFDSRAVWSLDASAPAPIPSTLLTRQTQVSSFGEDARGNLYFTTFQGDRPIARLVRAEEPAQETPFPMTLTDTGCFADVAAHQMAPGVIPYRVNLPFWSDGLGKERYAAFPDGAQASYRPEGGLELPVGTVLIKTFYGGDRDAPDGRRRIETRMLARFLGGWRGFTWVWNDAQDEATLLTTGGTVSVSALDGVQGLWELPSQTDCDRCHTAAAGYTLGWRAAQLNGEFTIDGVRTDQLNALVVAGYVTLAADVAFPDHLQLTEDTSLSARARAILDVNCASCHQPQGGANASMDLRAHVSFAETRTCGEEPQQGALGIEGARLIVPGSPELSVLVQRMRRTDDQRMPPLGSNRIDVSSVETIERWISSLQTCP